MKDKLPGPRGAIHKIPWRLARRLFACLPGLFLVAAGARAQTNSKPISVAVLDFANAGIGRIVSRTFEATLASAPAVRVADQDLSRAAARGIGYSGSLNLSLSEARDLGAAIGCDFYFIGDAQTLRRSPSTRPAYFESYASIFLVSSRTGKLIHWDRPRFEAATTEAAERLLLDEIAKQETKQRYLSILQRAQDEERHDREIAIDRGTPIIEAADDEMNNGDDSFRPPRPYRRLRPGYPDTAARADAEGTVDILVDLDKRGEINHADVARWAGFGLDEATLSTVRQLHFYPATRDRVPIPIRILLRYNFRRPTQK